MNKQKGDISRHLNKNNEQKNKLEEEKSALLSEHQQTEKICLNLEEKLKESRSTVEAVTLKIKDVEGKTSAFKMKNDELGERSRELTEKVETSTEEKEKEIEEAQLVQSEEVEELSSELKTEYENRMKNALSSLRDVYENQLSKDKEDYKEKYENKIRNLQSGLSKEAGKHDANLQETDQNLEKIQTLVNKIDTLQDSLEKMSEKEADLLEQIDQCNVDHDKKVRNMEISNLLYINLCDFS